MNKGEFLKNITSVVDMYTDGACSGNPGMGGWGVYIVDKNGKTLEMCGGDQYTTNNKMELQAVIEGLMFLPKEVEVNVHTDSKYVKDGMVSWIHNWQKNNWLTSDKKPVKNQDLWQKLLTFEHKVKWFWVLGHNGNAGNERADVLARHAIVAQKMKNLS